MIIFIHRVAKCTANAFATSTYESPRYPLHKNLGGHQSRYGRCGERKSPNNNNNNIIWLFLYTV
jgi:hypothetical protein